MATQSTPNNMLQMLSRLCGPDTSAVADITDPAAEERERIDAIAAYASVWRHLQEKFDITDRRTNREFYHVCRSRGLNEERLAALERLTRACETIEP